MTGEREREREGERERERERPSCPKHMYTVYKESHYDISSRFVYNLPYLGQSVLNLQCPSGQK